MFQPHPSLQDIILFWTYLKHFLEAGLPLSVAFKQLQLILCKKPWPALLHKVEQALLKGRKLSEALTENGHIFKADTIEMMGIAEKKGNYPYIIASIIESLKWQLQIKQTLQNLIRYPLVLFIALLLLLYIILGYVIPQLQVYLTSLGTPQLPLSTRLLIKMANWLPFAGLFLGSIMGWCFLSFKLKAPLFRNGKVFLEKYSLRLPVIGKLYHTLLLIKFIRMLAILLESGLDILVSLHQSIKYQLQAYLF